MSRSQHIRRLAAFIAALLVASFLPASARAGDVGPQAIPTFTVSGTGWGHGIGMSQYGARGSALAGKDHRWILGHYYTGSTLGPAPQVAPRVKVNIDCAYRDSTYPGRPWWTVKSVGSALTVWRTTTHDPTITLAADTWYRFRTDGTNVIITTEAGVEVGRLDNDVWLKSASSTGLLEVKEKSTSTDGAYHALDANGWPTDGFTNVRYRDQIWLDRLPGARLAAVNELPMDWYLYGVVPREMPASWGDDTPEALKAQAVAARSYAYADASARRVMTCTTWSQVYKGHSRISFGSVVAHEDTRTNAAVAGTSGQYIMYGGAVATGYFFSQSGGYTANNEDVWSGDAVPYLRGVPDPYEYLAKPPYAPWPATKEKSFTGLEMADLLRGLPGVPPSPTWVTGMVPERAASGHVRTATFRFSNGATAVVSGDRVRSRLGLMSTNFRFSGFPMERIAGEDRYATAVVVAQRAFPATAPAVVLASGEDFADALTGSGVAGAAGGPLLLTRAASLPAATRTALGQLKPATVYVMGGPAAVGPGVIEAVASALPGAQIVRIEGLDRYETAARAAEVVQGLKGTAGAIVVSGLNWPDAASASALAYARAMPILLSRTDSLGEQTSAYLETHAPRPTLLVGGTAVLAEAVASQVETSTGAAPTRLFGANRYETAAAVARYAIGAPAYFTYDDVYIATGEAFADALTGGTLAGLRRKPLVLTQPDACPAGTATFLTERRTAIGRLYLLGGQTAISEAGAAALDSVMMR